MLLYLLSIFLSAFLLFQIQPMIARFILPWFGGTSAVWSTVMLFFQVLLTGGYAYAYGLVGRVRAKRQGPIHLALLSVSSVAMLALGLLWPSPITPGADWKPASVDWPVGRIFSLLAVSIGLPYFTLAANSPLMQAWFSRARPQRSPYGLYALSNIGSLLALLTYPVVIEPLLTLREQGWCWSAGYGLFVGLVSASAMRSVTLSKAKSLVTGHGDTSAPERDKTGGLFPRGCTVSILWMALSATASALLLAVTNQMTQEVAAIPLLWVLPLTVYLLSFVLAFSGQWWGRYRRPAFSVLLGLASVGMCGVILNPSLSLYWQIAFYAAFLFITCMVAHGELYCLRPAPTHLTRFYLMVSLGGALGGVAVNLIAPYLLSDYWELHIGWALVTLLLAVLTFIHPTELPSRWRFAHDVAIGGLAVTVTLFAGFIVVVPSRGDIFRQRNFYGIVRVRQDTAHGTYAMVHGATVHGFQFIAREQRQTPTGYYWRGSGVGLALQHHPRYGQTMRVGVLGLGTGTLAAYGQPGDVYRFYEINPLVVDLANGRGGYFSFLHDTPAEVSVVLGDARLSLEQELAAGQRQNFDLLVLDTFSSDSIPVHLITREAFELYLAHLSPGGVIAAHISNLHLDLRPVLWQMGEAFGLKTAAIYVSASESEWAASPSLWMLLARDSAFLELPEIATYTDPVDGNPPAIRLWTDDYSNLFQVLK